FRQVIRRQDLHLLHGVDVLDADDVAACARPDADGSVDGNRVFFWAAAVDVVPTVAQIVEAAVAQAAAHDAGFQTDDADRIATSERHQLDVFRFNRLPDSDVGLERRRLRHYVNRLGDGACFERDVQ